MILLFNNKLAIFIIYIESVVHTGSQNKKRQEHNPLKEFKLVCRNNCERYKYYGQIWGHEIDTSMDFCSLST